MLFLDFKNKMYELGCFSVHQIHTWKPDFNDNNLTRWVKNGHLIKLRNGYYTFPDYQKVTGFNLFIANRIYKPSYISLHYALNFYGLIPESVTTVTSVSSLKTNTFRNAFGTFSYQTLQPDLLFGFEEKTFHERIILFASPEKAILDLFYLYPFYNTVEEIKLLRIDDAILKNEVNHDKLSQYLQQFKNKSLETRIRLFIKHI